MAPDPLATVSLGRTSLSVTRLGLGGAPLATIFWGNTDEQARSTVERALGRGIRLFDTAPLYGLGESERRLGAVLRGVERDSITLATKVGRLIRPSLEDPGSMDAVFDFSSDAVRRSLYESLERLGLERVDVVHIHDPDDHLSEVLQGTIPALEALRSEGTISAISAGANHPAPLLRLVTEADLDCVMIAGRYTLLDQSALDGLLPACAARDVAVIAAGVFNSGVLARPLPGSWYDYGPAEPQILERVEALGEVCERHGVPLQAAAVQFPFGHEAVACEVIGMRSPQEVDDNLAWLRTDIPVAVWSEMKDAGLLVEGAPTPSGRRP